MTKRPTSEPMHPIEAPKALSLLNESMDEAISALARCDADYLETLQEQVRGLTANNLARELAEDRKSIPELLRKHSVLGEMVNATAANLRVVVSILEAKRKRSSNATDNSPLDRSNLISWPR